MLSIKNLKAFYPANITAAIYPLIAIPARIVLESKNWKQAADLELQDIDLNWDAFPWQKAIYHYTKGLGAVKAYVGRLLLYSPGPAGLSGWRLFVFWPGRRHSLV